MKTRLAEKEKIWNDSAKVSPVSVSSAPITSSDPKKPVTSKRIDVVKIKKPNVFTAKIPYIFPIKAKKEAKIESKTDVAETCDEQLNSAYMLTEYKATRAAKRKSERNKVLRIFFVIISIYSVFLIYGVFMTDYQVEDEKLIAQKTNTETIAAQREFTSIQSQYAQARVIYEKILLLDYRVETGLEDPLLLAPEYEDVLEEIDVLTIQLNAMDVSNKYTQTFSLLTTWASTDIAVYCQDMTSALSSDSDEYLTYAEEYREISYEDFAQITENLITLGKNVPGADIEDMQEWSPEDYVKKTTGSAV